MFMTPAYRSTKFTSFSFVTPSSILSHKTGKNLLLSPTFSDLLFPFPYPWPALGCCTRFVKSAQYLESKYLVVDSERMAELIAGHSGIRPFVLTPFLLGLRMAEREMVLGD